MKRMVYLLLTVVIGIGLLTACGEKEVEEPASAEPAAAIMQTPSPSLLELFPQKVGTLWRYSGLAEYGHTMKLESINTLEDGSIEQVITGTVEDMSGGEATGDFSLELKYLFTTDAVRETVVKGEKLPHRIQELDVLRLPLEKGATWSQEVTIGGNQVMLLAHILEAGTDPDTGNYRVKVEYTAPAEGMPDGIYRETRIYSKGKGLVYFENTLSSDIIFSYSIMSSK